MSDHNHDTSNLQRSREHLDQPDCAPLPRSLFEEKLDGDTVDTIFSYLTLKDYCALSAVSRTMKSNVSHSSRLHVNQEGLFHKRVPPENEDSKPGILQETKLCVSSPQERLYRLLNRYDNLSVLNLEGLAPIGDDLIRILNRCPSASTLKSITLHRCALSYWCEDSFQLINLENLTITGNFIRSRLTSLLENSSKLKSLTFQQCPALQCEDIGDLSRILPNLEQLVLNHTKISNPVATFPNVFNASFAGGFHLTSLSRFHCPNLTVLDLSFCVRLSEFHVEKVVRESPALETLILVKCSGIDSLRLQGQNLRFLDASFMHNLSSLKLSCPSLRYLDTTCCSSLRRASLEDSYSLQSLEMGGLMQLRELKILDAWSLRKLNLRGCRRLTNFHIECPNPKEVEVEGWSSSRLSHKIPERGIAKMENGQRICIASR